MRWLIVLDELFDYSNEHYDRLISLDGGAKKDSFSLIDYALKNNKMWCTALSKNLDKLSTAKTKKNDESVASILELNDGLSYWHLSGISERCIVRNPSLEDYYIFLAIVDYIGEQKVDNMTIIGGSEILSSQLLKKYLSSQCDSIQKETQSPIKFFNAIKANAKLCFAAIVALLNIIKLVVLSKKYSSIEVLNKGELNFFCYSDNIGNKPNKNNFQSKYFRDISEKLECSGKKICWYHLYDAGSGLSRRKLFNNLRAQEKFDNSFQLLRLLDGYASLKHCLRVFNFYIKLQFARFKVERILNNVHDDFSSPWPFLKDYWCKTVSGGSSVKFLYQMVLLEELAKNIMSDKPCFFLCEGMSWERALIYFWKIHKKAPIYACIHSSIKSLDYRLTFYNILDENYRPNYFLFPSNTNTNRLSDFNFQESWLKKVSPFSSKIVESSFNKINFCDEDNLIGVVLDGIEKIDAWILNILEELVAAGEIQGKSFIVKHHPNAPITLSSGRQYSSKIQLVNCDLADLLTQCSLMICSIASSVAIDIEAKADIYRFYHMPGHLIRTPLDTVHSQSIIYSGLEFLDAINGVGNITRPSQHLSRASDPKFLEWETFLN